MDKTHRVVTFSALVVLLLVVFRYFRGDLVLSGDVEVVIFSVLLMLALVTQLLEHFFTKPSDVVASSISILLLLSPLQAELARFGIWFNAFYAYTLVMLIGALAALLLLTESRSPESFRNRTSRYIKLVVTHFGNGRVLFLGLFLFSALFYVDSQSPFFVALFVYAALVLAVDPQRALMALPKLRGSIDREVGELIGVHSKNTFLVRLHNRSDRPAIRPSDVIEFIYGMDERSRVRRAVIVDTYYLDQAQWLKIIAHEQISGLIACDELETLPRKDAAFVVQRSKADDLWQRFVGIVLDGTTIGKLRFQYCGKLPVSEGTLLEATVAGRLILYQVVQGITDIEPLELKNETAVIVGEAIQLGTWVEDRLTFDRFGWVPEINTPLFYAAAVEPPPLNDGQFCVGHIPGTEYQVVLNKREAVTHHLAILGVTGSGKSVFARNLVRNLLDENTRIICVDFTREYVGRFSDLAPQNVIPQAAAEEIFEAIDSITAEKGKFANQQDRRLIRDSETLIHQRMHDAISGFLRGESPLAIFELPDVSNTEGILDYTRWFFKVLFEIAKDNNNYGRHVCVVLEEAHTVIPEWNFLGLAEKSSQSLVNNIGQIALQGRKYNVGFVVIAQRTANVSKTVLTQCNTIVAFQAYDNTSKEFLGNYLPAELVDALPNLRQRQAIAVGKGFEASVPLIFEVPEIAEPDARAVLAGIQDEYVAE